MPDIRPISPKHIADLGRLLACQKSAHGCWCMWFIIRIKDYHQGGAVANEAKFRALAEEARSPMGFIAYDGGEPVGWSAVGPRSRYARAIRTPTMNGIDHAEDDAVWFVPCFFIRPERRGEGIARALLERAVALAGTAKAAAVEGFPLTGGKRQTTDLQVGTESLFASQGFKVVRRPSSNRVVMRLELPHGRR
jgi:GNAT superfamily N-acetyltransferase